MKAFLDKDASSKLKVCPFCGAQPELTRYYLQEGGKNDWMFSVIACGNCGASFHKIAHKNTQEVFDLWNQRI